MKITIRTIGFSVVFFLLAPLRFFNSLLCVRVAFIIFVAHLPRPPETKLITRLVSDLLH